MASRKDSKGRKLDTGYSQRKDGRYCYRYQVDGKTKSVYDWSLPELKEKVEKIKADIRDGISTEKFTLNQCFDNYIDSRKGKIRESTYLNYLYLYDRFVRDDIGKKFISDIKYSEMQKFYNRLLAEHLQIGTLRILHNALFPTFKLAVKDDLIRKNILDGLLNDVKEENGCETNKRVAMTEREQRAFMNYARNSVLYSEYVPLFTIFLGTGMRAGECFALTWEDVDLKNGNIHVDKTLIYKVRGGGKAEFQINPVKTAAGKRDIPMLPEVKKAFLEMKERRIANGICETVVGEYSDFVFANSRNHVHKPNTINRVIDNIIKKYNEQEMKEAEKEKREPFQIRHFSVHSFRHTFATNYCQHETNLKTIQEIMGHSDISITMKVYAEATEESKKKSFKNLEGKFMIG